MVYHTGKKEETVLHGAVLILDSNSAHIDEVSRKIGLFGEKKSICDCPRSNKIP